MALTIKIYTLTNPMTNEIFYIGKSVDLKVRYSVHISSCKKDTSMKATIIRYLLLNGLKPIIEEIDSIDCIYREDEDYANRLEVYWMHQLKSWGFNIMNTSGLIQADGSKREYSEKLKESNYEKLLNYKFKIRKRYQDLEKEFMSADNLSFEEKTRLQADYKQSYQEWHNKFCQFVYSLPENHVESKVSDYIQEGIEN